MDIISSPQVYKHQLFTSSGSFTVPAGVHRILVTLQGGGGSGGSGGASDASQSSFDFAIGGGGGGAGEIMWRVPQRVTPGASYSLTVGAGGSAASGVFTSGDTYANGYAGTAGGASYFAGIMVARGGGGGQAGRYSSSSGTRVAGGVGGGDNGGVASTNGAVQGSIEGFNCGGTSGSPSSNYASENPGKSSFAISTSPGATGTASASGCALPGGVGGGSVLGKGGDAGSGKSGGAWGTNGGAGAYGAGGGGGGGVDTNNAGSVYSGASGAGGNGFVLLEWL